MTARIPDTTTVAENQEIVAIRAVIEDADRLQSDADGFMQLLTEAVALVNFGGRRVLGRGKRGRWLIALIQTTPIAV